MCLLLGLQHGEIVCLCSFYCDHSFSVGHLVLLKTNKTAKVNPLTEQVLQNNWWRWDCDQRKLIEVNYSTPSSLHLVCKCSTECVCVYVCARVRFGASVPSDPSLISHNPPYPPPPHFTHTHTHPCLPPAESLAAWRSKQIDTPELGRINICRFTPPPRRPLNCFNTRTHACTHTHTAGHIHVST